MTLVTSYYLQDDGELDLDEIIRSLQKQYAHVQAGFISRDSKNLKERFKTDGKSIVLHTQIAVKSIYGQLDTAIKGEAGKALKKTVDTTLPKYEKVFS
ncbi:hypothetical protein [Streptococcus cuniculi]|uniref:Uncharacterized protein n=1 Tax=Streptococcus cuniculi TaxID=1432788 RepID=A0A4Y9JEW8_9STRE|nr:hypothetical protein [Streptococcus cuniculi]MBF0777446.1 hypothetical protein [Streptococcus cuniculi]TFU98504.1 hypothetical protein E4T82_01670 [Streptococcus cuniculi]